MTNEEVAEAQSLIAETRGALTVLPGTTDGGKLAELVWQKFYQLWEFLRPRLEAMIGDLDTRDFCSKLEECHNAIQDVVGRRIYLSANSKEEPVALVDQETTVIRVTLNKIEQVINENQ
jgi:hypothetical protein